MNKILKITSYIVLITFLFSQIGFADTIYFYHTDPAGTPIAMTDASGSVVWKADYKPFGEEWNVTSNIENNKRFVGKEKDTETGLNYFGARYMSSNIGRFISTDSVGPVNPATGNINQTILNNPQRLNLYSYGLNNPYKYVDSDGQWSKTIHNLIIERTFSEGNYMLSDNAKTMLMKASVYVDQDQSLEGSYKHTMRMPGQTVEQAEKMRNLFIKMNVLQYKMAKKLGKEDDAYFYLGQAMHALMDSTSPSHEGFQVWGWTDKAGIEEVASDIWEHKRKETDKVFMSDPKYLEKSKYSLRNLFDEANK